MVNEKYLLAIESSCDETSAAVCCNEKILSNVIANQSVHAAYGGVVPELASRAHQKNIVPVVSAALKQAGIATSQLAAIAFTQGPGLLGSLLVGSSFAKAMALGLNIPLIAVNHMQAHILAHFIKKNDDSAVPRFPFLCLTVSGGHTQLVLLRNFFDMEIIGQTLDDAAGEAFDKLSKILNLPYPGGPLIDKYGKAGNPYAFKFNKPAIAGFDFSFSGLKTNIINFIHKNQQADSNFIESNRDDICASVQHTIIEILLDKFMKAAKAYEVNDIAIAGGVSANSYLRSRLMETGKLQNLNVFIPPFEYCTDNAAMIAIAGYYKLTLNNIATQDIAASARLDFDRIELPD